ncbi:MAG: histidine kinase [Gammaproteobacteria bacterium]|nr:histidine kinase [Gammaproteobacteria bacterium]MDH3982639.1 histidine kinase [Gammaproteobacteria bacterium]
MTFAELLRDRGRLFWILNISGWSGYALAAWLGALAHEKPEAYFAVIVASAVSGFLATLMLRSLYQKLWSRSVAVLGTATLVTCYVIAFFWQWLRNVLYYDWVKNDWQPEHLMDYVGGVMGSFYIMLCWSGLYFGIKYYQQLQEQTEQTLKAVAAAHQAQLKMLRYQLNPHFLFNTLNAISTLILDGSNKTANQAVTRLSDFLRYTLDNDPMSRVTLGSELDALDLYLEIEKVRFGDRLIIEKDIDDRAAKALVPSLILQPLIENAIKYAISPMEEGGALRITARVQQSTLILQLSDTGPGLGNGNNGQKSSGVGLKNTRERLQQLYGDAQAFTLAPNEPTGLTVTINIPFEERDA